MMPPSAKTARLFGLILIVLVSAWDVDAMRAHIAAHSWATLAFVSLFLASHLLDYLTVGRLIHRPLTLADAESMVPAQTATRTVIRTAELYAFPSPNRMPDSAEAKAS
jgi:hypothetical protein